MGLYLDIAKAALEATDQEKVRPETSGSFESKAEGSKGQAATAQDSWEWIAERSAIMEIEGGLTRQEADWQAFELWFERYVGGTIERGL